MGSVAFSIHLSSPISHCTSEMYTGLVLVQTYRIWSSVRLTANWSSGIMAAGLEPSLHLCLPIPYYFSMWKPSSLLTLVFPNIKKKKILSPGRYINTWISDWEPRDRKLEILLGLCQGIAVRPWISHFISLHVNGYQPCWLKSSSLYVQFLLAFGRLRSSNTCEVFWDPPASSSEFIYKCKGKAYFKNTSTSFRRLYFLARRQSAKVK